MLFLIRDFFFHTVGVFQKVAGNPGGALIFFPELSWFCKRRLFAILLKNYFMIFFFLKKITPRSRTGNRYLTYLLSAFKNVSQSHMVAHNFFLFKQWLYSIICEMRT